MFVLHWLFCAWKSSLLEIQSDALLLLGTTPQRREFEYPRVLSKTSPHAKIVEEFRKNYIVQEALETDLPCDSDSDEDTVRGRCVHIPSLSL